MKCITEDKIAVCVGVKNRSQSLLANLIASMNECLQKDHLVLSLVDCGSNDIPSLETAVESHWRGNLVFAALDEKFTRTSTLNKAIEQCGTGKLFLCDSDMTLPVDFVKQYNWHVSKQTAWFPICFDLFENKPQIICDNCGTWRYTGYGMVGILLENFRKLGGLDERFITWGKEDYDFYLRSKQRLSIRRYECRGLFHNWHPMSVWRLDSPERLQSKKHEKEG